MARNESAAHGRTMSGRAPVPETSQTASLAKSSLSRSGQRSALVLVGLTVAGLVAAAISGPPRYVGNGPRASLSLPVTSPLPVKRFSVLVEPLAPPSLADAVQSGSLSAQRVAEAFDYAGYDLTAVAEGSSTVPRLFLASMPRDLGEMAEVQARKQIFFRAVLPLVLQVNAEIQEDRRRLWNIHYRKQFNKPVSAADRRWLAEMGERYDVAPHDDEELLKRVDAIPPSLALAQAAEESGWGTSRFVREGNALFGQWTFADDGHLVPVGRAPGRNHKIMAFPALIDSVRAYALNLNTHRAYREFREMRAHQRSEGRPLSGVALAGKLGRYSERGPEYVRGIRAMIATNSLHVLDQARLSEDDVEASLEQAPFWMFSMTERYPGT